MSQQKVGQLIDGQDVTLDLDDTDLVSDIVLLAKVSRSDGSTSVAIGASAGMDWITQLGLVTAATQIINTGYEEPA